MHTCINNIDILLFQNVFVELWQGVEIYVVGVFSSWSHQLPFFDIIKLWASCALLFLPSALFKIFLRSLLDDSENPGKFSIFINLASAFYVGQDLICIISNSIKTHSNPKFQVLGFESCLCDYKGVPISFVLLSLQNSQKSFYIFAPWICKNIAKSYAIFFI